MSVTGLKINTQGQVTTFTIEREDDSLLPGLYREIGCDTVEKITLGGAQDGSPVDMWMDEEGRVNGSPINVIASMMVGREWGHEASILDALTHGTVLLLGFDDETGETLDMPEDYHDAKELRAIARAQAQMRGGRA